MNADLKRVIRDLNRCSSYVNKPWAIEADLESSSNTYQGVIMGSVDSPIWGSVFHFTLQIDPLKLSEPPQITFTPGFFHPLIEPVFGTFCYPPSIYELSSRMDMETFLDELVHLFLLERPFTHAINTNAARSFQVNTDKFWAICRQTAHNVLNPNQIRE